MKPVKKRKTSIQSIDAYHNGSSRNGIGSVQSDAFVRNVHLGRLGSDLDVAQVSQMSADRKTIKFADRKRINRFLTGFLARVDLRAAF